MPSEETAPTIALLRATGQWYTLPLDARRERLHQALIALLEELCVIPHGMDSTRIELGTLGIDSLDAFEIESEWEIRTGITLDTKGFLQRGTVAELVGLMMEHDRAALAPDRSSGDERDWTV